MVRAATESLTMVEQDKPKRHEPEPPPPISDEPPIPDDDDLPGEPRPGPKPPA